MFIVNDTEIEMALQRTMNRKKREIRLNKGKIGRGSMGLTPEQKEKYLIPQAQGKKIGAYGLTEPSCGSDVANLQTRANREGDEYIINGAKQWISLVDVADNFLIFARLGNEKGAKGIAGFIVEKEYPGVTTNSFHDKLGVRTGDTGEIILQNVRVPAENPLVYS